MSARLNRRRYREVVAMLKEVVSNPKATTKQRLQAGQTLLEVYARHDRTEAVKQVRRRAAEATSDPGALEQPETVTQPTETAEEAAQRFLETIRTRRETEATGE
jgi:hypothetical protein